MWHAIRSTKKTSWAHIVLRNLDINQDPINLQKKNQDPIVPNPGEILDLGLKIHRQCPMRFREGLGIQEGSGRMCLVLTVRSTRYLRRWMKIKRQQKLKVKYIFFLKNLMYKYANISVFLFQIMDRSFPVTL